MVQAGKATHTESVDVGKVIHKEHQDLFSVLTCLRLMARKGKESNKPLHIEAVRQAFYYMEMFLNMYHHPKEETYLFPLLRLRCPDLGDVLDELSTQHQQLPQLLTTVQENLARYEADPEAERENLCDAIEKCCTREIGHMKLEESKVLSKARDSLTAEDWHTIDTAFAENKDPLFSEERTAAYDVLFRELVNVMPQPFGYGDPA